MSTSSLPPLQHPPSVSESTSPKLHLYTQGTPNGFKPSIYLEELIETYGAEKVGYDYSTLSFQEADQKKPEFLKINPNGRIPALVDENFKDPVTGGGHGVFESASILLWLAEKYDSDSKFWFEDSLLRSKALSWIFFAHGGVGPMQGQANHFFRYAPEKIEYGIKRYQDETRRLYSVLEDGLNAGKGEWLVGDKYSIADINVFGWVNSHAWAGVEIAPYPKLSAWLERIRARPAVKAGLDVPKSERKKNMTKEEEDEEAKKAAAWIFKDQKKD